MNTISLRFLGKVFLIIVLLWVFDSAGGFILDHLYKKSISGVVYQENYIINNTSHASLAADDFKKSAIFF